MANHKTEGGSGATALFAAAYRTHGIAGLVAVIQDMLSRFPGRWARKPASSGQGVNLGEVGRRGVALARRLRTAAHTVMVNREAIPLGDLAKAAGDIMGDIEAAGLRIPDLDYQGDPLGYVIRAERYLSGVLPLLEQGRIEWARRRADFLCARIANDE